MPLSSHRSRDRGELLGHLRTLALQIRDAVLAGIAASTTTQLSAAVDRRGGDVIYGIDTHAEDALLSYCREWSREVPFLLIAEGLEEGQKTFPDAAAAPTFTLIVDPVDGSRELMFGKRSAWTLLGLAPPPRPDWHPTLADVVPLLTTRKLYWP